MKTLEEQLETLEAGDEVEFRNGKKEIVPERFSKTERHVSFFGIEWIIEGFNCGCIGEAVGNTPLDIVRVIPRLEDGWIRWKGGERPVGKDAQVEVELRSGRKPGIRPGGHWTWYHYEGDGDIVAYRVVEPASIKERLVELRASSRQKDSTDCLARKSDLDKLLAILIDREPA